MLYERLAASPDPLLREIGAQLRLGQIRPADLLAVPEYRQLIRQGVDQLRESAWAESVRDGSAWGEPEREPVRSAP